MNDDISGINVNSHQPHRDSLVINGRHYGAKTGRPIDGLIHPSAIPHTQVSVSATRQNHQALPAHLVHHRPQQPAQPAATVQLEPPVETSRLQRAYRTAAERATRAQQIARSAQISKFGQAAVPAQASVAKTIVSSTHASSPMLATTINTTHSSPPLPLEPDLPTPVVETAGDATSTTKQPSRFTRVLHRPKAMTIGLSALSTLAIIGYITYLNIPHIALRVAASRAGIDVNLPDYQPSGFRFAGPASYDRGSIVLNFRSTAGDARAYTVSEQRSDWDSQSLLENYVRSNSDQPLTFQQRGLTIYVYDDSKATWVNHGLWYTVEGDSLLNSDQLLKIASSL